MHHISQISSLLTERTHFGQHIRQSRCLKRTVATVVTASVKADSVMRIYSTNSVITYTVFHYLRAYYFFSHKYVRLSICFLYKICNAAHGQPRMHMKSQNIIFFTGNSREPQQRHAPPALWPLLSLNLRKTCSMNSSHLHE